MAALRLSIFLTLALATLRVSAGATCNATQACPETAPCCSEFGFCGAGEPEFCLGGCNPLHSASLTACRPNPICENKSYSFDNSARILSNVTFYDGNSTQYDWVVDKGNVMNSTDGGLAMLLTEANGGTKLSSTKYVHYGKITANMKVGKWGGIVTAFITMSDIKDEIDWEFPGKDVPQSNYFWQGVIPNPTRGGYHKGVSDPASNYHDYTIDWQEEQLTWSIDGEVVRTLKKSETLNSATGVYEYPTTPSRIQLSLWPAGIESSGAGTIEWAGGMIDFNDPDYKAAGQFWATVKSIKVECADANKHGADITGYVYGANASSETPNIMMSNASTLLNGAASVMGATMGSGIKGAAVLTAAMMLGAYLI